MDKSKRQKLLDNYFLLSNSSKIADFFFLLSAYFFTEVLYMKREACRKANNCQYIKYNWKYIRHEGEAPGFAHKLQRHSVIKRILYVYIPTQTALS